MEEIDDDSKKELLGHFIYQVGMMKRCFYRCIGSSFLISDSNGGMDEDLMVAFLVHIRVFYKFFIQQGEKGIEAHASDYIDGWEIDNPKMREGYKQINSYLSHLDYERVKTEVLELYDKGVSIRGISEIVFYHDKHSNRKKISIGAVHKIIKENRY
ncbi:hypothetical protein KAT80_02670 [Candidatus Pacearchaeota archaeon]|nr:hypothetical protein [Candidatus Pacearchaeota archaeon]